MAPEPILKQHIGATQSIHEGSFGFYRFSSGCAVANCFIMPVNMEIYTRNKAPKIYSKEPDPFSHITDGQTVCGARYEIIGNILQAVSLRMPRGHTIVAEPGALAWMQDGIEMHTNIGSGLDKAIKRLVTGESLFTVRYTAYQDDAIIGFSAKFPGRIIALHLSRHERIIAQRSVFLVGEKDVSIDIFLQRRLGAGLFGGEGLILQQFTGPGTVFVSIDGEYAEYLLTPGERLKIDTGYVAMFESSVKFDIEFVKGIRNILFGGEGLFMATLTGPGRVWIQTMPASRLVDTILSHIRKAEAKNKKEKPA